MYIFNSDFLLKFLELLLDFDFCGKTSVLTMSSQDKIKKKDRGKVLLWPFYGGLVTTICKMVALMFRCWMKKILQFRIHFFFKKARVT